MEAQPQRHALRHLTVVTDLLQDLHLLHYFEVKLRYIRLTTAITENVDYHTHKQVKPDTTQHIIHKHTHTNNSQSMHAWIHSLFINSFIQSIFTLSLFHKNEPSITIAVHHNLQSSINHQPCIARTTQHGIRTCTHDITMARTQWNGMHLHAYRLPTTTLQRYIHTYMHA